MEPNEILDIPTRSEDPAVSDDQRMYSAYGVMLQEMLGRFLVGHPEVTDPAVISVVVTVLSFTLASLTGLDCDVELGGSADDEEKRRYMANAKLFDSQIIEHITTGRDYVTAQYPTLVGLVGEDGVPLAFRLIEDIVGSTLNHFFGIRQAPYDLPGGSGDSHVFLVTSNPLWKILGLDNHGSISNQPKEVVDEIVRMINHGG